MGSSHITSGNTPSHFSTNEATSCSPSSEAVDYCFPSGGAEDTSTSEDPFTSTSEDIHCISSKGLDSFISFSSSIEGMDYSYSSSFSKGTDYSSSTSEDMDTTERTATWMLATSHIAQRPGTSATVIQGQAATLRRLHSSLA